MGMSSGAQRVVVTGLGAIHGLGHDADAFWQSLVAGRPGVGRITQFDPSPFPTQIGAEVLNWNAEAHMDPKEARRNDRYTHFGFVAALQAVKDAGLDLAQEDPDAVGVLIGSGIGGMFTYETQLRRMAESGPRKVSPFTIPALIGNICSGLVAIHFGVRGPNFGVVSACATSTHAIGGLAHDPAWRRAGDDCGRRRSFDHTVCVRELLLDEGDEHTERRPGDGESSVLARP